MHMFILACRLFLADSASISVDYDDKPKSTDINILQLKRKERMGRIVACDFVRCCCLVIVQEYSEVRNFILLQFTNLE